MCSNVYKMVNENKMCPYFISVGKLISENFYLKDIFCFAKGLTIC